MQRDTVVVIPARGMRWLVLAVPAVLLGSCGAPTPLASGGSPPPPPPGGNPVTQVSIIGPTAPLNIGDTVRLRAVALDASGNPVMRTPIVWTSADPTVLQVDSFGLVHAVDSGFTTISAQIETATGTVNLSVIKVSPGGHVLLEEDWDYASTADMLADPRHLYTSQNTATESHITLDNVSGGGSTKSMLYTWPDRTSDPSICNSYTIGRNLIFPQPLQEVWVEAWTMFSSNFTTKVASCAGQSNAGYKFIFGTVTGAPPGVTVSRFNLEVGVFGDVTQWNPPPENISSYYQGFPLAANLFDGKWHQWQMHMKVVPGGAPNAIATLYFDGRLLKAYTNVAVDRQGITGLALGRNMNQGPTHPQTLHWGLIRVYDANPGW